MNGNHWHILGAGAMGCLFASQLVEAGCRVTLLLRHRPEAGSSSLTVESENSSNELTVQLDHAASTGEINHLLITTKAQDAVDAVKSIAPRIGKQASILFATNGMGYAAAVKAIVPDNPIYYATSTEGAYRLDTLHIRHAGRGITRIGSAEGLPQPSWHEDWRKTSLDCQWDDDITTALWHKMAINCAINPLTAIHQCLNGELARRKQLKQEVGNLCDEIAEVSLAAGFDTTAATLHEDVTAVIAGTADNRSSMLQDVAAGRSTEIDFITGYLLRTAQKYKLNLPHNKNVFNKVLALGL
ncbi:MAG: 2-dehydropantoate 2-reductase [Halieaceae bacterium]|nr:2-dehydropantoate 2-reductase [Halieaceae bacterium]